MLFVVYLESLIARCLRKISGDCGMGRMITGSSNTGLPEGAPSSETWATSLEGSAIKDHVMWAWNGEQFRLRNPNP